jgi:hypothetical protein
VELERYVVVLDPADLDAKSAFWAGLLGGRALAEEDWHSVLDASGNGVSASSGRPTTSLLSGPTARPSRSISTST